MRVVTISGLCGLDHEFTAWMEHPFNRFFSKELARILTKKRMEIQVKLDRRALTGALLATTMFTHFPALAQADYPNRAIKMVVGWPAGGPADAVARMVAQKMSENLGHTVVIDNRPGAGGNIGTEAVAQAKADGYTILLATGASHGLNTSLYAKLGYDAIKDFGPIGLITISPSTMVVPANSPYKSVHDLVQAAKAAPGKLNYGSAGTGSSPHLAAALFNQKAGVDVTQVPYKGTAPAITDLMAGRLDFMITIGSIPHVKSGQLRALAVASKRRIPALPDLPTFEEAGVANFTTDWWYGLVAPAGTPPAMLERLNTALNYAIKTPELQKQFVELGAVSTETMSKEQFWDFVRKYMPAAAEMVRVSGAKAE